jgi:hypothetical protein
MASGRIGLAETFGVRALVSGKPFAGAACNFGFDAPTFGVVDGTLVQLSFDQEE